MKISEFTARRATRRLFALYLFISALALAFPFRPKAWPVFVVVHSAVIVLLLNDKWFGRLPRLIQDWYALGVIPALYTELAILNVSVWRGQYFDDVVIAWEQSIFGGQPSRELAQTWPWLPLSEFLHFSYLAYYLIIYGPPLYLYLRGRRDAHQMAVFTLMLTFFAHYIFFIYFPVSGPRYLYPAPDGEISRGFFYGLTHQLLESGSARGAAFPSSHVGVSFAQAAFVSTLSRRWGAILIFFSSALALGAVYGGFHYATDAIAGLVYGVILFAIAPRIAQGFGETKT